MAEFLNLLEIYQYGRLTSNQFLGRLYDLAVFDWHENPQGGPYASDCIKTAQIGTEMKKEINFAIEKHLVKDTNLENKSFSLLFHKHFSDNILVLDKIQREIEKYIEVILIACIDNRRKKPFIYTCLNWEKTFLEIWEKHADSIINSLKNIHN